MKYFVVSFVVFLSTFLNAQVDSFSFVNVSYILHADSSNAETTKKIYFPPSQNEEYFYEKILYSIAEAKVDFLAIAKSRIQKLETVHKSHPESKFKFHEVPTNQDIILSHYFIDRDKKIAEFNVEKYCSQTIDGVEKIIMYKYTYRAYEDDIATFLSYLTENEELYVAGIQNLDMHTVPQ